MRGTIHGEMKVGRLPNPYEIRPGDVGELLDLDFGTVQPTDVGRLLFLRGRLVQMESIAQREARLAAKA